MSISTAINLIKGSNSLYKYGGQLAWAKSLKSTYKKPQESTNVTFQPSMQLWNNLRTSSRRNSSKLTSPLVAIFFSAFIRSCFCFEWQRLLLNFGLWDFETYLILFGSIFSRCKAISKCFLGPAWLVEALPFTFDPCSTLRGLQSRDVELLRLCHGRSAAVRSPNI